MESSHGSKSNDGAFFDWLPDEMVLLVLCFVETDTLLSCRRVCKKWLTLVDLYAFQEKASRENETVNNGRGYHSFSDIDSSTVRKLDLPWYVFYAICKYDPFNRNLVKNHCGQSKLNAETIILFAITVVLCNIYILINTRVKTLFGTSAVWFVCDFFFLLASPGIDSLNK